MSGLAKAVLKCLQVEKDNGKNSFTALDLTLIGHISMQEANDVIDELEANDYIEVHNNIADTFSLI